MHAIRPHRAPRGRMILLLLAAEAGVGCFGVSAWTPTLHDPSEAAAVLTPEGSPFLKVHMESGELYVLDRWEPPSTDGRFSGAGWHYDADRARGERRERWTFEPDGVALLETNDRSVVSRFAFSGLVTYTVLTGITTAACLADPKSCFGSCPTFYGEDPDRPLAEGFSRSFARVLEERDLDDLGLRAGPGAFSLLMRNEAFETHAIRHVRLVAVPLGSGERVVRAPGGGFHGASRFAAPVTCRSRDGDCLEDVLEKDDREYAPPTDGQDLGAREEVVLEFAPRQGSLGVVLAARQSLVSTFLFYQGWAYAGADAGEHLAALERGEPGHREAALALPSALGAIEVFVQEGNGPWAPVGAFDEAGPIATDTWALPFRGRAAGALRVKLRMARGAWRVDRVALATLAPAPDPVVVEPDSVIGAGGESPDNGLERLLDAERHLVTAPGSALRLWFDLPPGQGRYALFLESQGFYYEWMRGEWMAEQDAAKLALMLLAPEEALRELAPAFKQVEPTIESLFWSSRFRR